MKKDNDNFQQFFPVKKIIYCDDSKENKYNCYMKNSNIYNNYTCDMCQNDFLFKYNKSNVNVSFINCFEPNEILPNYNSCYNSCKACEIEGNEIYQDNSNKQLSDLVLNEIIQTENGNGTIQNIIDEIFNEFENNKIDSAMNP